MIKILPLGSMVYLFSSVIFQVSLVGGVLVIKYIKQNAAMRYNTYHYLPNWCQPNANNWVMVTSCRQTKQVFLIVTQLGENKLYSKLTDTNYK